MRSITTRTTNNSEYAKISCLVRDRVAVKTYKRSMESGLRAQGMQTSPPACLCHAVNGMLGAQATREDTYLLWRVSQWLSTRLGGVFV